MCKSCYGSGCLVGKKEKQCIMCRGAGYSVKMRQIAPGMVQQYQQQCTSCNGSGTFILNCDKCNNCNGNKLVLENYSVLIKTSAKMQDGEQVIYPGEGNQTTDGISSDILFTIKIEPHSLYKRIGNDLFIEKTILLRDSLFGVKFDLETIDKRIITVISKPNQVIKPLSLMMVENEGMPRSKGKRGNLYIKFIIEFPDKIENKDLYESLPVSKYNDLSYIEDKQVYYLNSTTPEDIENMGKTKTKKRRTNANNNECQNCIM